MDSTSNNVIPLTALSKETRRQLSSLLNPRKILRSKEGFERDWRGLAILSEQKYFVGNSFLGNDPVEQILQLWCTNSPTTATFANFEHILGVIDRWDIFDDIRESLLKDALYYRKQRNKTTFVISNSTAEKLNKQTYQNLLTKDDVLNAENGLSPKLYDAFVLFSETDINYAVELIAKLEENEEYNFQLCVKDRDLLTGTCFSHVALTQLIEERCKHLIVILTQDFLRSTENKFLVNYTQALQIEQRTRKIIPLLYDNSVVPKTLKMYTYLKYNNTGTLYDFWDKLAESIKNINCTNKSVKFSGFELYK